MEGGFNAGLPFLLAGGIVAQGSALGVDADPTAAEPLKDVSEDAFFIDDSGTGLVMQDVGSVGHRDIAQHADGDDVLRDLEGLVFAADDQRELLVARGDIAVGGDIDKERREHEFERILVALVDGLGPSIFNLLELSNFRALSRSDAGLCFAGG